VTIYLCGIGVQFYRTGDTRPGYHWACCYPGHEDRTHQTGLDPFGHPAYLTPNLGTLQERIYI